MRLFAAALLSASTLSAQAQSNPAQVQLTDVLPPSITATQVALTSDANRVYFSDSSRALWFYDRSTKQKVSIAPAETFDLTLSPHADALAFARAATPGTAEHHIYVVTLDPRTGLPSSPERRVGTTPGDAPSISPDGKTLAFAGDDPSGVSQSLIVVPMSGAAKERVLATSLHASIGNIRWAPDGESLYIGVNPPVRCNPSWSCLDLKPEFTHHTGTVRRVSLRTGKSELVASQVASGWPGLSADGNLLAFTDTTFPANLIVADNRGRTLRTVAMPQRQTVEGWLGGSTLVFSDRGDVQRLRALSIADGTARVIADSLGSITDPVQSPDGGTIGFVTCIIARCDMHLVRSDGAPIRTITLPDSYRGYGAWSPDGGKHIAYFGAGETQGKMHASVVDVAAGTVRRFADIQTNAWALAWTDDSRALTLSMIVGGTGAGRRVAMTRVALDGTTSTMRDIPLGPTPSFGRSIDMTTAVTIRGTTVARTSFDGDAASTVLVPPMSTRYLGWFVQSRDGRQVAIRRTADSTADDVNVIDVVNVDGTNRVSITVPFALVAGTTTIHFLPDGKQLAVLGIAPDGIGLYLVDIATKSTRRLVTIPGQSFTRELSISADGRTIYYVTNERSTSRVFTMDLSSLREEKR